MMVDLNEAIYDSDEIRFKKLRLGRDTFSRDVNVLFIFPLDI